MLAGYSVYGNGSPPSGTAGAALRLSVPYARVRLMPRSAFVADVGAHSLSESGHLRGSGWRRPPLGHATKALPGPRSGGPGGTGAGRDGSRVAGTGGSAARLRAGPSKHRGPVAGPRGAHSVTYSSTTVAPSSRTIRSWPDRADSSRS